MATALGPQAPNYVLTKPPMDTEVSGGADTWFKDCSGPGAEDGTVCTASWLNGITEQIREAIRGAGVALAQANPMMLFEAIQEIADERIVANTPVLPSGMIIAYAGTTAPTGWLFCDGSPVSRTGDTADLFAKLDVAFGNGNGTTTFNLPDLRGRVVAGRDDMGGTAALRLTTSTITGGAATIGKAGGEETHVITVGEMATHKHTLVDPGHTHNVQRANIASAGSSYSLFGAAGSVPDRATEIASTGITMADNGSSLPHNNVQPTLICNYIIKK